MLDRFNRNLDYLRISVTDRCNLRCTYCMPERGISLLPHDDILSFDEITQFTTVAAEFGVTKVRITGGEPLVRRNVSKLVRMISEVDGIADLSMTTNGILLKEFAHELRDAGLDRINISLDTVNPEKYSAITRCGNIRNVFEGIEAARTAGFLSLKINCVIRESKEESAAREVANFCLTNNLEIRYIRQMDLHQGHFSVVDGGTGGDCSKCNRLRLTSNGKLKPCLFNKIEFDIRELGYAEAIAKAVQMKPEHGSKDETGTFYKIGG